MLMLDNVCSCLSVLSVFTDNHHSLPIAAPGLLLLAGLMPRGKEVFTIPAIRRIIRDIF